MNRTLICLGLSVFLFACRGPQQPAIDRNELPHLGAHFFEWRAQSLGISLEASRERDQNFPGNDGPPPHEKLDQAMAKEAARLWQSLCAACHGLNGVPPKSILVKPRTWGTMGTKMGFFFGGDKMRSAIYQKIADGQPPNMPAWNTQLSREQIWALVKHLEGF